MKKKKKSQIGFHVAAGGMDVFGEACFRGFGRIWQ